MPTRLIREGIISSDRINDLDWAGEVFYRRLLNKVDDHGLYDARPSVLRTSLYPLKVDRVREADCSRWLAACEKAGLLLLYQADGKPFLKVLDTRWQARSEPKYPVPSVANSCKQLKTPVPVVVVGDVSVVEDDKPEVALRLPEWLPADAWKAWLEVRKKVKAPNTPRALQLALTELVRLKSLGHDPAKVLDQSTLKGWKSVYPLKPELVAVTLEPKAQLCDYCTKPSGGTVNGRRACDAHWPLAMANERPAKVAA